MTKEGIIQLALESATDRYHIAMRLYEKFPTFQNLKYMVKCERDVEELKRLISPHKPE